MDGAGQGTGPVGEKGPAARARRATDEIYEKYLQKAIAEINELAHEVAQAGGGSACPCVGSGHPLADVMLLKYRPQAAEVQEGVAFYGRAGQAILKSLQRLHVDPMAVYGTNCLKFADGTEDESRAFLTRELHIVQPKLIVAMGETRARVPERARVPARAIAVEYKPGELQRFTPTIEALVVPDIDASLDEAGREDPVLERVQAARQLVGRAAALLALARGARRSTTRFHDRLWNASTWWDIAFLALVLIPAVLRARLARAAARDAARAARGRRSRSAVLAWAVHVAGWSTPANFCKLLRDHAVGFWFLEFFESLSWVVLVALIIPWVDAFSVWRGPTKDDHREARAGLHDASRSRSRSRASGGRATSACPTCSSSPCSSPRRRASGCAPG